MLHPLILWGAVIFDRVVGEPPERIHPVVWIGKLIYILEDIFKSSYSKDKVRDLLFGSITTVTTLAVVLLASYSLEIFISRLPELIQYPLYSLVLSTTIGYKSLLDFSRKPIVALREGDIGSARRYLQCIVSRDTSKLDREHILSASVESLSENITDSIIAPLIYGALFGLPGAFLYRAVNTLDAMIGYRNDRYEYYGKLVAYLDDLLNIIPSRIAGLLLVITSPLYGGDIKGALYGFLREGSKTPSPNSGYTMATVANSLEMTLEKIGYYRLGRGKIDVKKAYNALKAVDVVVISFLTFYTFLFYLII
ncbi:MAG TPA: cobalamin biosynthesis protein [Methanothermococcus okinawensis]|uniref:Probable cobalamin biosynthesis protein CobD n=1 Tax=Methanothermococcus okinawensis TaxID=155863 RepID=A0A833E6V1_9EURY|nr:cobalamin biosynthesis protein [Methanococcaceae archaeon]HIP84171.1 cobalamin biosynthesis protein [Methanothermococcus okinawensis]HIP91810.1 cobalamin biosynthesis protein [Methanothermococcus okinawensis]